MLFANALIDQGPAKFHEKLQNSKFLDVAQLVEQSLPIPEFTHSNPGISHWGGFIYCKLLRKDPLKNLGSQGIDSHFG